MNPGMQKRRDNTTRYDFRSRNLSWRVEWRFMLDQEHNSSSTATATARAQSFGGGVANAQASAVAVSGRRK